MDTNITKSFAGKAAPITGGSRSIGVTIATACDLNCRALYSTPTYEEQHKL
jgi:hypothetical protein